jgi:hypothetical protein
VLARLHAGIDTLPNLGFLTLTSTPDTSWETIMAEWSHMVRFLRRRSPQLEYAAIKEQGARSGMKHLHVLLLRFEYTAQHDISEQWRHLTGAWVVNIQRPPGNEAAGYCAKYVSKDLTTARKNVTFSKGWPKLPPSDLHLVPLEELGCHGPTNVRIWTEKGGIVDTLSNGCQCFGSTHPATLMEHLWLKSLPGRSPPLFRAS